MGAFLWGDLDHQDQRSKICLDHGALTTLVMDSPVPLMHHDPDRSWITDPDDPDHPKGTHPGGVLGISSHGDDRRIFLGLKFSIPGFFWVRKFGLGSLI